MNEIIRYGYRKDLVDHGSLFLFFTNKIRPIFLFKCIYFESQSCREKPEREKNVPSTGLHLRWLQRPVLGRAEEWSQ